MSTTIKDLRGRISLESLSERFIYFLPMITALSQSESTPQTARAHKVAEDKASKARLV